MGPQSLLLGGRRKRCIAFVPTRQSIGVLCPPCPSDLCSVSVLFEFLKLTRQLTTLKIRRLFVWWWLAAYPQESEAALPFFPTVGVELSRCTRHAVISPHYLPLFQGAFLEGTSHNILVGPNSVTRAAARSKAILTGHSASLNRNEVPLLRKERDINAGESSAQIGGC